MRVQLAHNLADHTGRFHIRTIRIEIHLAHLIDDAALHRLQTISGIGQRAGIDHRIRVFEERLAHFLVQRVSTMFSLTVRGSKAGFAGLRCDTMR